MGLDLHHLKATLTPSNPEDNCTFREDDFDEFALDVLGFSRFLQTIPFIDSVNRILAVKEDGAPDFRRAHDPGLFESGVEFIVGDPTDLIRCVEEIERAEGLDATKRCVFSLTEWIDQFGCKVSHGYGDYQGGLRASLWEPTDTALKEIQRRPARDHPPVQTVSISYPVESTFIGIYTEKIGYQRKGMAAAFYENFGSPSWYVRLADVERAYRFLDPTGTIERIRDRQEFFTLQFLAGFEEGISIFDVGW